MVARGLTEIQRKIFRFIQEETETQGAPPTLRAICKAFDFRSIGSAQDHIRALVQKGFLEKDPGKARGIRFPGRHRAGAVGIPVLGTVPAGIPLEAIEITLGTLPVPLAVAKKGNLFALKVTGESMTGAGIHDGDWVIARQQKTAQHGDIVVALLDGAATVKRLEQKGKKFRLLPENPDFAPIDVPPGEEWIQGKVVAVQRYYESSPV
jgi:repressor LexA